MSKVFNMVGGGGGPAASIFVTGLSETDTVTATNGSKTLTGKWTKKPNPAAHGLPDGYTELEYIESTGTQYINPNINIVNGLYTKCVYRPTDLNTDNHVLSSRTSTGFLFAAWQQKTNGVGLAFGSSDSNNTFTSYSSSDVVITQETTILSNTAKSSFNGTEFASIDGTASNVNSAPLYLFCMYDSGTASYFAKVKLYELFASVNGVPAHDFIPAKRNSDGAIGLYDIVSNTFFENAGTGTFTAGPEIPQTFDGFLIKPIRDFGTWTVTATYETDTYTQDVLVDVITEYEIDITKKLYLYRDGDECEDVTGGWVLAYASAGSASATLTKNADNMYISYTGGAGSGKSGGCGTVNQIDLTPFSKLYAEVSDIGGTASYSIFFDASNTITSDGTQYARVSTSSTPSDGIMTLDVSSVNTSAYIRFMCQAYKWATIHKVWLEK